MIQWAIRRVLQGVLVLGFVISLTFFLIRLAPGGPFDRDRNLPAEVQEKLLETYHLDQPVFQQYTNYLGRILHGDLGPSFIRSDRSVNQLIEAGVWITFELGVYALFYAMVIGLTLGIWAGTHEGTWQDRLAMGMSLLGMGLPSFLLGPLLVWIFGMKLGWVPVSGWDSPASKILPVITLGSVYASYLARLMRTGIVETQREDYIRTARAKGLSEGAILIGHTLRTALIPVMNFLGPAAAALLSGSFVVETLFQIPGLGRFYVQAAFNRDYTMILGTTVFLSVLVVTFNMLSDFLQMAMNPRIRLQEGGDLS